MAEGDGKHCWIVLPEFYLNGKRGAPPIGVFTVVASTFNSAKIAAERFIEDRIQSIDGEWTWEIVELKRREPVAWIRK